MKKSPLEKIMDLDGVESVIIDVASAKELTEEVTRLRAHIERIKKHKYTSMIVSGENIFRLLSNEEAIEELNASWEDRLEAKDKEHETLLTEFAGLKKVLDLTTRESSMLRQEKRALESTIDRIFAFVIKTPVFGLGKLKKNMQSMAPKSQDN